MEKLDATYAYGTSEIDLSIIPIFQFLCSIQEAD